MLRSGHDEVAAADTDIGLAVRLRQWGFASEGSEHLPGDVREEATGGDAGTQECTNGQPHHVVLCRRGGEPPRLPPFSFPHPHTALHTYRYCCPFVLGRRAGGDQVTSLYHATSP